MTSLDIENIITQGSAYKGLSNSEAEMRLKQYGFNSSAEKKRTTGLKRIWGIVSEPMMLLLIATAVIYFFVGTKLETVVLFLSIIPIAIMEFFQEKRTDEALAALDKLVVQECTVYREGKLVQLGTKYVVPGDIVYVTAGSKVPADGLVLESPGLMVDEAILTGETVPVVKAQTKKNPEETNKMWQGTLVVQGEGYVLVTATGRETKYGQLGSLLEHIETQETPLQKKIKRLVKRMAIGAVSIAVLFAILITVRFGLLRGLVGGLTIAIAIIPEEFPIVFSVFLIMGVWRMTKQNALVREMAMVETLGSATVICSDKTGTLTEGTMVLKKVFYNGKIHAVDGGTPTELFRSLIHDALLALEQVAVDPIEVEMQRYGKTIGLDIAELVRKHTLRKDSSFDAATKMVHHTWTGMDGSCHQYTAGAPEFVIDRSNLSTQEKQAAIAEYENLAKEGYRVVGIARTACQAVNEFAQSNFTFSGLLAMTDPPRAGVKEAIVLCRQAGVRVIMITGDNKLTARAIARSIDLPVDGNIISGVELEKYSSDELQAVVKRENIFARVKPEQKYLIVEALQKNGEIVAMTGDGVNDAPALKRANIGIAMGQKGTEVAREAAGIVLLDDNFTTIVNAVKEGRRIYDNLRHSFIFLFSLHLPIIGLALVPLVLGQELFFFPVQIIFLEFFGDPAAVLGFERDKLRRGAMQEPPRPVNEPLINRRLWKVVGLYGLSIFAISFGFYYYGSAVLGSVAIGRTMGFVALVVAQIMLVLFSREWEQVRANKVLLLIGGLTVGIVHIFLLTPGLRELFHFVSLTIRQYGLTMSVSVISMLIVGRGGNYFIGKK